MIRLSILGYLASLVPTVIRFQFLKWDIEVWRKGWRLTLYIEDGTAETVPTCRECGSLEIGEVSRGDEGWTACRDCCAIEQGYTYISKREAERK